MAIILFEKNKGEAISVATIQGEFGNQFEITGQFSSEETNRLSILIRSGALAAPMDIIEERTIGPSLGADNISKGFHSTLWGFIAIAVFMCLYYRLFGLISSLALAANLLLLVAVLSLLQATLTLPGIAAIALTLGMAIDANVLINERIREERRRGRKVVEAVQLGYKEASRTIFEANTVHAISGLIMLVLGSGPVKGFAVVLLIGICTSVFTAVTFTRMLTAGWIRKNRPTEIHI
jgi:preprotein translocase subunit SecD